jgi:hypothetical protein
MSAEPKNKQKKRATRNPIEHPDTNGKPKRSSKRLELASEVAAELETLRATLEEMTEHYRLRLGGQIGELLQAVRGEPGSDEKTRVPPARSLEPMLEALRNVRLKPRKGRAKDFDRMQDLLEELTGLTPPES